MLDLTSWPRVLVAAVVLGMVAAAIVWYLERFEAERMRNLWAGEIQDWLASEGGEQQANFARWLREKGET